MTEKRIFSDLNISHDCSGRRGLAKVFSVSKIDRMNGVSALYSEKHINKGV